MFFVSIIKQKRQRDQLKSWLFAGYPSECCHGATGLVVGGCSPYVAAHMQLNIKQAIEHRFCNNRVVWFPLL